MIVLTVFVGCTRQLTEKNETSSENLQSIFDHEELKIHIVQDGGWDTDFTTVFNPKNQITTINILVKGSFDSLERHDYVGNPYQTYEEIPVRIQVSRYSRGEWSVLQSRLCKDNALSA